MLQARRLHHPVRLMDQNRRELEEGIATEDDLQAIRAAATDEVEKAAEEAARAPLPGPERLMEGLYA